jgi:hypothetical protein
VCLISILQSHVSSGEPPICFHEGEGYLKCSSLSAFSQLYTFKLSVLQTCTQSLQQHTQWARVVEGSVRLGEWLSAHQPIGGSTGECIRVFLD